MSEMHSEPAPELRFPNVGSMLGHNALRFPDHLVFASRFGEDYIGITWKELHANVCRIIAFLNKQGFGRGSRLMIFAPNSVQMLQTELAVMSMGGVCIPVFAWFKAHVFHSLFEHSDATFLAVGGKEQIAQLGEAARCRHIIVFDDTVTGIACNTTGWKSVLETVPGENDKPDTTVSPDEICLNMYTSGTMGIPKGVQLTHRNILSQQDALCKRWNLDHTDRFLSYLPWHHSFGGIFELFAALYNAATLHLESGYGKDPAKILENWEKVKPTVFFSVPKVYQSLAELAHSDKKKEDLFFRSGLKFIFTAAAPLPRTLSDEFESHSIAVMEGWGLTETAPCCTLTIPGKKREPGVVGFPIPGVKVRLSAEKEIQVKGPNVMRGYYKNDRANESAFTPDGWYCTGDVGEISPNGLKLISRKDRIFKLTNGEKVIPTEMEEIIQMKCHYVMQAMVVGGGTEYPVAVIFPNRKLFNNPNYVKSPDEGCYCPRTMDELGKCLQGCLRDANCLVSQKFSRIRFAMIIDDELSIEKSTLTPSLKIAPGRIQDVYKAHIENMYGANHPVSEEVFIVKLDSDVNNPAPVTR
ncbi:MAG: AMP-binding protein [Bacteroidia bacterium]|nr:AMP-binding protein [Bacteroidia bacterium]